MISFIEGARWTENRLEAYSTLRRIQQNLLKPLASPVKIKKNTPMLRFVTLLAALSMSYMPSLMACEGCKEPSNVAGDSGVAGISASFSWSVLFMICMIGVLLSSLIVMMIRSCKQLAQQQQANQPSSFASSPSTRARQATSPSALSLNGFGSPAVQS
jgi:hypothetical protein